MRLRKGLFALAFWLLVWQGLALAVGSELLLPSPLRVARTLWGLLGQGGFWLSVALSLGRIVLGFALGVLCGALLALGTHFLPLMQTLLPPLIRLIRATPVASFILLAILWLHSDLLPVLIAALMVLPVVWEGLSEGLRRTDQQLLELAAVYRLSPGRTLRLIYLPSLRPWVKAACLNSMGLAWKSGIAAEVLSQPRAAIGTQLYQAKVYFESEQLFAWTAVAVSLSLGLERLLRRYLR